MHKVQRQAHIYHKPPSQLLTYEWAPAQIHHLKPKHAHNHLFTQLLILWIWMNNSSEVWIKINPQKHTGIHTFIRITAVSTQTHTPIHLHKCDLLPVATVWPNRPPRCCLSSGSPCVEAACCFFSDFRTQTNLLTQDTQYCKIISTLIHFPKSGLMVYIYCGFFFFFLFVRLTHGDVTYCMNQGDGRDRVYVNWARKMSKSHHRCCVYTHITSSELNSKVQSYTHTVRQWTYP